MPQTTDDVRSECAHWTAGNAVCVEHHALAGPLPILTADGAQAWQQSPVDIVPAAGDSLSGTQHSHGHGLVPCLSGTTPVSRLRGLSPPLQCIAPENSCTDTRCKEVHTCMAQLPPEFVTAVPWPTATFLTIQASGLPCALRLSAQHKDAFALSLRALLDVHDCRCAAGSRVKARRATGVAALSLADFEITVTAALASLAAWTACLIPPRARNELPEVSSADIELHVLASQILQKGLSDSCAWPWSWRAPILTATLRAIAAPFIPARRRVLSDDGGNGIDGYEGGECDDSGGGGATRVFRRRRLATWKSGGLRLLLSTLPALLDHEAAVQTAALRCARHLVSTTLSTVANVFSTHAQAACIELARAMQSIWLLRPLCDALGAHPRVALRALAAFMHTQSPRKGPDPAVLTHAKNGVALLSEICQAGEALCCTVGQQLLAHRSRVVQWLQVAPLSTLRVLLHACRALPALGAALATDAQLQTAIWRLLSPSSEAGARAQRYTGTVATETRISVNWVDESEGVDERVGLIALLLIALLLAHSSQQAVSRTESKAVLVALQHVTLLAQTLAPTGLLYNMSEVYRSERLKSLQSVMESCAARSQQEQQHDIACVIVGVKAARASAAAGCLAELLRNEGSAESSLAALQVLRNERPFAHAVMWLSKLSSENCRHSAERTIRDAEGSSFSWPYTRAADGFAALLHRLLVRLPRKHSQLSSLSRLPFWRVMASTLMSSGHHANLPATTTTCLPRPPLLSPVGTLSLIRTVHQGLVKFAENSAAKVLDSGLLAALLSLLAGPKGGHQASTVYARDTGSGSCRAWAASVHSALSTLRATPASRGGGPAAVAALLDTLSLALHVPFGSRGKLSTSALVRLQQAMYNGELLGGLIYSIPLAAPHDSEVVVGLVSRLVLGSSHFAQQYVALGGLMPSVIQFLLSANRTSSSLTDALLILCHVARLGTAKGIMQAPEDSAVLSQRLSSLLCYAPDAVVRARACNLLGNLCKHSSGYYQTLLTEGTQLSLLAARLADEDAAVRKFACFAAGNIGFHSSLLYSQLTPCVAPLVACLEDADPKTRTNAAGALGNLVRNGPQLCVELIRCDVPRALLCLALQPTLCTDQQRSLLIGDYTRISRVCPSTSVLSTADARDMVMQASAQIRVARTALFSLGNLAAHASCHASMLQLMFPSVLDALVAHEDLILQQHTCRVLHKLQMACTP